MKTFNEVALDIDQGFDRMPIRSEGVHWLRADEWDVIKGELGRVPSMEKALHRIALATDPDNCNSCDQMSAGEIHALVSTTLGGM